MLLTPGSRPFTAPPLNSYFSYDCKEGYSTTDSVADTFVASYTCQWDETWAEDPAPLGTGDPCSTRVKCDAPEVTPSADSGLVMSDYDGYLLDDAEVGMKSRSFGVPQSKCISRPM